MEEFVPPGGCVNVFLAVCCCSCTVMLHNFHAQSVNDSGCTTAGAHVHPVRNPLQHFEHLYVFFACEFTCSSHVDACD